MHQLLEVTNSYLHLISSYHESVRKVRLWWLLRTLLVNRLYCPSLLFFYTLIGNIDYFLNSNLVTIYIKILVARNILLLGIYRCET